MPSNIAGIIDQSAEKYAPGDDEFKKVLHAIVLAESGGNPLAVGDQGNSIGLFQNNMAGGRGQGYSVEQLSDPYFNADLSVKDLLTHYKQGLANGLSGANLVAFVSRYGQRPAAGNEWNAAKNYGLRIGQSPQAMNEQTTQVKSQEPQSKGLFDYFKPQQAYAENYTPAYQNTIGQYESAMRPYTDYMVKSGDTLWDLAQRYLGGGQNWKRFNYQGDPRLLQIGTRLRTPQRPQDSPQPNTSTNQGSVYTPPPRSQTASQFVQAYSPSPTYALPQQPTTQKISGISGTPIAQQLLNYTPAR